MRSQTKVQDKRPRIYKQAIGQLHSAPCSVQFSAQIENEFGVYSAKKAPRLAQPGCRVKPLTFGTLDVEHVSPVLNA